MSDNDEVPYEDPVLEELDENTISQIVIESYFTSDNSGNGP